MEEDQGKRTISNAMDEVRVLHLAVGSSVSSIIEPTFKIITPHLLRNKNAIQAITPRTETYGPHTRQKLDIYQTAKYIENSPILVFFYGGGMVRGDKIMTEIPDGLVYHNLGSFFAQRGIITIVPDYRRVNSKYGGEGASFPSGGEDVSLVLKWLESSDLVRESKRDVFIMGNSAGGLHISTFMLEPRFIEQRKVLLEGRKSLVWKGAIEIGVPFHFKGAAPGREGPLKDYYGMAQDIEDNCPYGLLEAVSKTGMSRQETAIPNILALVGEYDPEDEVVQPIKDFIELHKKTWGDGIESVDMVGHNHISPPLALMSGEKKAEKWGEDVFNWIQGLRS